VEGPRTQPHKKRSHSASLVGIRDVRPVHLVVHPVDSVSGSQADLLTLRAELRWLTGTVARSCQERFPLSATAGYGTARNETSLAVDQMDCHGRTAAPVAVVARNP
jgi:hypothetical protein